MGKKELIFVPAPGAPTHMISFLEFGNSLLQRWDQQISVTILIIKFPPLPSILPSSNFNPNIKFIEVPDSNSFTEPLDLSNKSIEKSASIFIASQRSIVKQTITDHFLSKSIPVSGLVIDFFCTSMIDVADELGFPSYMLFTSSAGFLRLMLHVPVRHDEIGREYSVSDPDSVISGFVNPVPSRVLPSFLLDKDGGYEAMEKHGRRYWDTKGIFVNTFAELESHVIDTLNSDAGTPPVFPVGPFLNFRSDDEKPGTEADELMKWLDNQPPSSVLYLCFGSRGVFESTQLSEIAIALERSGQRFLWSVRETPIEGENTSAGLLPEGFVKRTENRGMVCGWAPQEEVLAHESVGGFISHCGWNSVLESIWHGVPMATWPLYAEQQINAFYLAKELKIAVELSMDYRMDNSRGMIVMADEIEEAIRNLMNLESPIRKKVKKMSEVSRKAGMVGGSSIISIDKFIEKEL